MGMVINLVATRSKDGDHPALLRWYSDHVHLLLGFAGLQCATLYRRVSAAPSGGPDYLCLYEFSSHADFLAFEVSPARAQAQQVAQTGWARDGIEIVQRTQYLRLGQRTGHQDLAGRDTVHHIQSLGLGAGSPADVARWLADRVHCTLGGSQFGAVAWHRAWGASQQGGDALVVAASSGVNAAFEAPLEHASWLQEPPDAAFGAGPASLTLHWQGAYQRQCCWTP